MHNVHFVSCKHAVAVNDECLCYSLIKVNTLSFPVLLLQTAYRPTKKYDAIEKNGSATNTNNVKLAMLSNSGQL